MDSIMAVKHAIGGGETFFNEVDIIVSHNGKEIIYKDVYVRVSYNVGYMQMDIDIMWDDDRSQPSYRSLGLHAGYNTNFQKFSFSAGYLRWQDSDNQISIRF